MLDPGPWTLLSAAWTLDHNLQPKLYTLDHRTWNQDPVSPSAEPRPGVDALWEAALLLSNSYWSPNWSKNIPPDWRRTDVSSLVALRPTLIRASLLWLLLPQITAGNGFEPHS